MRRRLALFWEKHEAWVVPIALACFLGAGIQIGIKIGSAETALTCNKTVNGLSEQIGNKDQVIEGKDSRLRLLQDSSLEAKDETIKVTQEAAAQAAAAAKAAAEAAKAAADAATTKPTKE